MPNVRFVQGSPEDFSITYDTDWPVIPRVGEFISITIGTDEIVDWEVTRVAYVAGSNEKFVGSLVWVERSVTRPLRQTYQAMGFDVS